MYCDFVFVQSLSQSNDKNVNKNFLSFLDVHASLGINGKSFNDSKIISKHKMKVYGEIFHLMKL